MRNNRGKLERRSLAQQVEAHIRQMILSGELKSGERIPEESLAREFNISRTPIREALRSLEDYGLVEIKPRTYARVESITLEEARQVAEVRSQLESLAVRLVTENAQPEDIAAIEELARECKAQVTSGDLGASYEKDSLFHLEIAARSGNYYLHDMLVRLDSKVMLYRLMFCRVIEKVAGNVKFHDMIVDAIKEGDAVKAADIMARHALSMGQEVSA